MYIQTHENRMAWSDCRKDSTSQMFQFVHCFYVDVILLYLSLYYLWNFIIIEFKILDLEEILEIM